MAMASPPHHLLLLLLLLLIPAILSLFVLVALYFIVHPRRVKIPIKGRHVFITGGSSGIGLAMARRAAAEGARVSILARDRRKLEAARDEIRLATGAEVAVYSADVRDEAAVREAIEAAGTIDVLVCNQGVSVPLTLEELDMKDVRFQIDVNLVGTLNLVKATLPGMKKAAAQDGKPRSISFTSSPAGQVGIYAYAPYSATNFALRGVAEALQMELINDNIHLSLILPGDTDTPGAAQALKIRPQIANLIAGETGFMKADDVARKAINGIKSGNFVINITPIGVIACLATAGFAPQTSLLMAFAEVMTAGLMRFVALCYLSKWYKTVQKHHTKVKEN